MFYTYIYRDPRPNKNHQPVYVGKGQDKTDRADYHWDYPEKCHNKHLRNLLLLLKRENLAPTIEIVFRSEIEQEALDKEVELIALFGRKDLKRGPLFNNTDGGEGLTNLGPETIARRTTTLKITMNTPEMREQNRQQALRAFQDSGVRAKHLEAVLRNAADPNYRAKLSDAISEARGAEESRAKTSAASGKMWQDEEYRRKTIAAQKSGMQTPEAKENRGSATKAGWQNPETRRKRLEGIRASRTPELKARISKSCKALWTDEKRLEFRAKMKIASNTPEALKNRSEAAKAAWTRRKAVV